MENDRTSAGQSRSKAVVSGRQWGHPYRRRIRWRQLTIAAIVVGSFALVHCPRGISTAAAKPDSVVSDCHGGTALPSQVASMLSEILAAVHAGRIEDLRNAIEWNELPPELGNAAGTDPIQHLKSLSADGEGREILAIIANVLATAPAKLPIGADPENNAVYVWPGIAEKPLDRLAPSDYVELLRLMPQKEATNMIAAKKWTWWRLAIGADGTWLTFMRHR